MTTPTEEARKVIELCCVASVGVHEMVIPRSQGEFFKASFDFTRDHLSELLEEMEELRIDAERWREVCDKAWFVDAAATVYDLHDRYCSWHTSTADEDDVTAAIDKARLTSSREIE